VLVELSVMEQRYQAVLAVVQDGWKVTEVAARLGVSRQSVHAWIVRYEAGGLAALVDRFLPSSMARPMRSTSTSCGAACSVPASISVERDRSDRPTTTAPVLPAASSLSTEGRGRDQPRYRSSRFQYPSRRSLA
jgi:transposase-like protein